MLTHIISAQELKVEGDLNVTGAIQNDSLMLIIADLQAQIVALQAQLALLQGADNKLETRLFSYNLDLTTGENVFPLDFLDITGEDLSFATFQVVGMNDYTWFDYVVLDYQCDNIVQSGFFTWGNGELDVKEPQLYLPNSNCRLKSNTSNQYFNRNLFLSITAQFTE